MSGMTMQYGQLLADCRQHIEDVERLVDVLANFGSDDDPKSPLLLVKAVVELARDTTLLRLHTVSILMERFPELQDQMLTQVGLSMFPSEEERSQ